jgi:hypothetical protein
MERFQIRRSDSAPEGVSKLTEAEVLMALQLNSLGPQDLIFENGTWLALKDSTSFGREVERHANSGDTVPSMIWEFVREHVAWSALVLLCLLAMALFVMLSRLDIL